MCMYIKIIQLHKHLLNVLLLLSKVADISKQIKQTVVKENVKHNSYIYVICIHIMLRRLVLLL